MGTVLLLLVLGALPAHSQNRVLSILSGSGQITSADVPAPEPLVVYLRDAAGRPVENAIVDWAISGAGTVSSVQTVTDAGGRAANLFIGGSAVGYPAYQQSVVQASVPGAAVRFIVTTTYTNPSNPIVPIQTMVLSPPLGGTLTGISGTQGRDPIHVRVLGVLGVDAGRGIQGIEVRLSPVDAETIGPGISCAAVSGLPVGSVMTDAAGEALCYPVFASGLGRGQFRINIGAGFSQPVRAYEVVTGPPSVMRIESGDRQTGLVGTTLPVPLVAAVSDAGGNGLDGVRIAAEVTPPEAAELRFLRGPVTVNGGRVELAVTIRAATGPFQVTLRATPSVESVFRLTATAPVSGLEILGGSGQTTPARSKFPLRLRVRVSSGGQPLRGTEVRFSVSEGTATVSPATALSDASGEASTEATAGIRAGAVTITAQAGSLTQTFRLNVIPDSPVFTGSGFSNATWPSGGGISPCSLGRLSGLGFAPGLQGTVTPNSPIGPLPYELADVSLRFGNGSAPLLAVTNLRGEESVTFQTPCETIPGTVTVLMRSGTTLGAAITRVAPASPGIFEAGGRAVAVNAAGRFVGPDNPAQPGERILLYVTGIGLVDPPIATNQAGGSDPVRPANEVVVGVNHQGAEVVSVFYAHSLIGAFEVLFVVPPDAPAGADVPLSLTVKVGEVTYASNASRLSVGSR